ncbi:MAG: ABC transporter permease [Bacteroidetes bacterium]|nr:ABC transporter permease [Bacteroidota bacterium]
MLIKSFLVEIKKTKNSFTLWFTLIGSALIPLVYFFVYLFRFHNFIPELNTNPWDDLIKTNFKAIGFLLFPLFIIITIGLNIQIEHTSNSWKKLFVLPMRKEFLFFSKLLFLLTQILFSLILFGTCVIFSGLILGIIHKELGFLMYSPDFYHIAKLTFQLYVSVFGIISIQYLLGLFFENLVIPISIGTFLSILGLIIAQGWDKSIYYPYAFPMIFTLNIDNLVNINHWMGISTSEIVSISIFVVVITLSFFLFKKKAIK